MSDEPRSAGAGTRLVSDVMHQGVLTCPPETSLQSVAAIMATERIHCVVVFTDEQQAAGRYWGVLSDLDLMGAVEDLRTRTAGDTAITPVVMVTPDASLRQAASMMNEYRTAHLIVVDPATTRPVGVISSLDVASAIASYA